ncbi:hypothetical protein [Croceicoccus hydrothermalis]|uniref:hypothetical protein n=1 Tax=Croceicoccus hydrothermalis TaxID=2867964 RepID=UPI001EFB3105|nr:hypothetical protein [Croceicoccus hydrothermalis]
MQIHAGDRLIGSGRIERVSFLTMGPGETMDIGNDTGRRVMEYPAGPEFSGQIDEVIIGRGN